MSPGPVTYFFAYARKDGAFVLDLAKRLRSAGVDVWVDQLDILAGERWDDAVERGLRDCGGLIVVLSPDTANSQNVMDEVSYALEEGKRVVPLLLRACEIPFRLHRLQRVDFTVDAEEGFSRLLESLGLEPTDSPSADRSDERPRGYAHAATVRHPDVDSSPAPTASPAPRWLSWVSSAIVVVALGVYVLPRGLLGDPLADSTGSRIWLAIMSVLFAVLFLVASFPWVRRLVLPIDSYRRRSDTLFAVLAPAGVAVLLSGLSLAPFLWNRQTYRDAVEAARTLVGYQAFQESCGDAVAYTEVVDCYGRLTGLLDPATEDRPDLRDVEPAADFSDKHTLECLGEFSERIAPAIRDYANHDELLRECQERAKAASSRGDRWRVLTEALEAEEARLAGTNVSDLMTAYSRCDDVAPGFRGLRFDAIERIVRAHLRFACLGVEPPTSAGPRPARKPPATKWLLVGRAVGRSYTSTAWRSKFDEWTAQSDAMGRVYTDAQDRTAEKRLLDQAEAYAHLYAEAWARYLKALELRQPPAGDELSMWAWLEELSKTEEYHELLAPAIEALSVADEPLDPPFNGMHEQLAARYDDLASFVADDLEVYQRMLAGIGEDLERCGNEATCLDDYRAAWLSGHMDNGLAAAQTWVRKKDRQVAVGYLVPLLMQPLDRAGEFFKAK